MKLTQKRVRLMIRRRKQLLKTSSDYLAIQVRDGLERSSFAVGLTVENPVDGRLGDLQPLGERDLTKASSGLDLGEHLSGRLVHGDSFYTRSDTTVNTRTARKLLASYTSTYIPAMTNTIADRLDHLMKLRGVRSQSELARRSGVPQATISRTLKGGSVPELETIKKLAEALSSTSSWLADGIGPGPDHPDHRPSSHAQSLDNAPNLPLLGGLQAGSSADNEKNGDESETRSVPVPLQYYVDKTKFRPIPVIGRAQGGMPERIWTDGDYPVGATDKYAEVATSDPHAFITPIIGTSMAPRYNPGEYALVEPATAPELEDDVLIRLNTGETMLKRLISRRGGIQLASYNEPGTMLFDETEITWMYYVAHPVPARKIRQRV